MRRIITDFGDDLEQLAPAPLAQPNFRAFETPLKLFQARARRRAPAVEPGAQERDAIPVVAGLRLQLLDLVARAHWLQPAVAGVLAQRDRESGRFGSRLQLGDPLALPRRLSMHGVLETLEQCLQVRDPLRERVDARGLGLRG